MKSKSLRQVLQYVPDGYEIETGEMDADQVYATRKGGNIVVDGIEYSTFYTIEINKLEEEELKTVPDLLYEAEIGYEDKLRAILYPAERDREGTHETSMVEPKGGEV